MNKYRNLTASALVKTGTGSVRGIFVASASATPTIKVTDSTDGASGTVVNTFTPAGATFYDLGGAAYSTGLHVAISGTVDCTVFYD